MRVFAVVLLIFALGLLGACTTISGKTSLSGHHVQHQQLPIKSFADALVTRFNDRGWAPKADPAKQVSMLAHFLVKGIGAKPKSQPSDPVDDYLASLKRRELEQSLQQTMLSEIRLASVEIRALSETVDSAHKDDRSGAVIRTQMLSLEQALLTTRKARKLFELAAHRSGAQLPELQASLQELDASIDVLTNQADGMNKARQLTVHG